jgi:hypothetical protein
MLTLPFNAAIHQFYCNLFLCSLHPQQGGKDLSLLGAALVTDSHTGITPKNQNSPVLPDHLPDFFERFLLSHYHCLKVPSVLFFIFKLSTMIISAAAGVSPAK